MTENPFGFGLEMRLCPYCRVLQPVVDSAFINHLVAAGGRCQGSDRKAPGARWIVRRIDCDSEGP